MRRPRAPLRITVNPIVCDGYGHCAEMLPELIGLDEWGYPVLADTDVPPQALDWARKVVRACPRNALALEIHKRS